MEPVAADALELPALVEDVPVLPDVVKGVLPLFDLVAVPKVAPPAILPAPPSDAPLVEAVLVEPPVTATLMPVLDVVDAALTVATLPPKAEIVPVDASPRGTGVACVGTSPPLAEVGSSAGAVDAVNCALQSARKEVKTIRL